MNSLLGRRGFPRWSLAEAVKPVEFAADAAESCSQIQRRMRVKAVRESHDDLVKQ